MICSETTFLRKELAKVVVENDEIRKDLAMCKEENVALKRENVRLTAKLAFYESPNMPTSKPSLFNGERREFRKSRNEDPGGSPGEAANGDGKKRGPPMGHKGVSHSNRPSFTIHYGLDSYTCPGCGTVLAPQKPVNKLVSDLDGSWRMLTCNAVIEWGVCMRCNTKAVADTPLVEGTSLGPVTLAVIMILTYMGCTPARIAYFFDAVFGFKMSENTVSGALHAMAAALVMWVGVIATIRQIIQLQPWIRID